VGCEVRGLELIELGVCLFDQSLFEVSSAAVCTVRDQMALMEMNELFYGEPEPTWIINNNSRRMHQAPSSYSRSAVRQYSRPSLPHEVAYDPYNYYSNDNAVSGSRRRHVVIPVVELMVPMCCTKCEEKLREEIFELDGIQRVICDQSMHKVVVTGFVDPLRVLKKARRVKKRSQFWSAARTDSSLPLIHHMSTGLDNGTGLLKYNSRTYPDHDHHHNHHEYDRQYRTAYYNRYDPSGTSESGSYYFSPQNYYDYAATTPVLAHSRQFPSGHYDVITNPYYLKHIESQY
jgi:hypothetical protein